MDLTTHEEELVTQTFAEIAPQVEQATEIFYNRLFEVMPSAREMFGEGDERLEMFNILATAVKSLSYSGSAGPDLTALGQRHVTYGVTLEQFDVVEQVLMWTFEQILGDGFTPQARATWEKVYKLLKVRVVRGNYMVTPPASEASTPHTGNLEQPISDTSAPQTGGLNQQSDVKPAPPASDKPSPQGDSDEPNTQ